MFHLPPSHSRGIIFITFWEKKNEERKNEEKIRISKEKCDIIFPNLYGTYGEKEGGEYI